MAQRTDQLSGSYSEETEASDDRSLAGRASGVFSPKYFLLALLTLGVAFVVGNTVIPFVPVVGGLVGVLALSFVFGAGTSARRYLEIGLAGAVVSAVVTLLSNLFLSVVGNVGVPMAAIGGVSGLIAALLGYYLGRDLRDGLTREI